MIFQSRKLNTIFEYRIDLIKCMEKIINYETIKHLPTIQQASGLKRTLNDKEIIFWLTFFHNSTPHVDILYNQLQKRKLIPQLYKLILIILLI